MPQKSPLPTITRLKCRTPHATPLYKILFCVTFLIAICLGSIDSYADAKPLLNFKKESLVAELTALTEDRASGALQVTIAVSKANGATISELTEPARIVIDFPPIAQKINTTSVPEVNAYIKSVRVGTHPDKLRVVVDLIDATIPLYDTTQERTEEGFIIRFTFGGPSENLSSPTTSPTALSALPTGAPLTTTTTTWTSSTSTTTVTTTTLTTTTHHTTTTLLTGTTTTTPHTSTRTTTTVTTSTVTSSSATSTTATTVTTTTTPPTTTTTVTSTTGVTTSTTTIPPPAPRPLTPPIDPSQPLVTKISFSHMENTKDPGLEIKVTISPEYKLTKKSEREFLLTIDNCKLPPGPLGLPLYAPQDFDGFTHAVATSKGEATEVLIGVDRGAKLSAFTKEGSLWVKAIPAPK